MADVRELTVRQLIEHFIPGAPLTTESEVIFVVEGCRTLIETGGVPDNEYAKAFMNFYNKEWMDCLQSEGL